MGKKKDVDLKRAFGVTAEMLQAMAALVQEIESQGGQASDVRWIEKKEIVRAEVARVLVEAGKKFNNVFPLTINYAMSLSEMIEAGNYDWVNDNITVEHFPITGEGQQDVKVKLLHPNRYFNNSKKALAYIDEQGYRPATLPELLALGAKHPELQRQFPIAALGSIWRGADGSRYFVYLNGSGTERGLNLCWIEDGFGGGWCFAVVRKQS